MTLISAAAKALIDGALVGLPTETVYGLAADASNEKAIARIYEVKGRPADHPLIVHIGDVNQVERWAFEVPDFARKLIERFWPGPLTLVFKRTALAKDFITGGQETVAIRMPSHEVALSVLREFHALGGSGVAAPSANRFGKVSPTTASDVLEELGKYLGENDLVLEGGQSQVGIESTIVDCTGTKPAILRPGFITSQQIESVTGLALAERNSQIRISGNLASHYAPNAKVELDTAAVAGDGLIALAEVPTPPGVTRLAAPRDAAEYASQLYAALRKADELSLNRVVALAPKGSGVEVAILDRLLRASAQGK